MTLRAASSSSSPIVPGTFTLATMPDPTVWPRMYIWVSDLFGGPGDYCISNGADWRPVRPLSTSTMSAANATLTAMVMAPTLIVDGTIGLGITRTLTLSTQYAYNGAKFRVTRLATGVGALVTSLGLALPLNGWTDMEFNGTAWVQTGSGGLL